jgi:hypothetical protein
LTESDEERTAPEKEEAVDPRKRQLSDLQMSGLIRPYSLETPRLPRRSSSAGAAPQAPEEPLFESKKRLESVFRILERHPSMHKMILPQ